MLDAQKLADIQRLCNALKNAQEKTIELKIAHSDACHDGCTSESDLAKASNALRDAKNSETRVRAALDEALTLDVLIELVVLAQAPKVRAATTLPAFQGQRP